MKPEVSIICNTYNQAKYIGQALDGFLMQKTDFPFEVLVHDDASTDGTDRIIKKYAEKHPDIIFPIYETENQWSKGVSISQKLQYPRVRGKYIALCEGDDYWTDPQKLQKQYAAMEANPDCNMCAHGAMVTCNEKTVTYINPSKTDCILSANDVILGGGQYIATASLFYRKNLIENPMQFLRICHMDYMLQMYGAMDNGIIYLHDIMSVYRQMTASSWSKNVEKNPEKYKNHLRRMISVLELMDEETECKYSESITQVINEYDFELSRLHGGLKCLRKRYWKIYHRMSPKGKLVFFFQVFFPFIPKLRIKIRQSIKNGKQ